MRLFLSQRCGEPPPASLLRRRRARSDAWARRPRPRAAERECHTQDCCGCERVQREVLKTRWVFVEHAQCRCAEPVARAAAPPPRRRHLKSMQLREAAHRSLLSAALRRREMLASLWNRASTAYRAKVGRELSNHGAARPRDRCADAAWIACWRPVALALGCRHRDFSDPRRDAPTSLPSCREAVGRIRWRSAGGSARRSHASGWRLSPCRHPRTFRLHPASPSPLTLTAVSQGCCTRTALLKRRR